MTPQQKFMKDLEERDYSTLNVPPQFLHFIKMRDRLAYYSLQLEPFFYQDPWDLPVVMGGGRCSHVDLMRFQGWGISSVEIYNFLTDVEVALIEAAARRGIRLRKRPRVDNDDAHGPMPQRSRMAGECALGE
ncbi:MAG: hypothetical protein BM559_13010 [Roseobacter sp. MedPE-SWchi]|nr:MAG: hypothetical protein BM559_13010 [Roseobacter sp. MedPE-SWchi]